MGVTGKGAGVGGLGTPLPPTLIYFPALVTLLSLEKASSSPDHPGFSLMLRVEASTREEIINRVLLKANSFPAHRAQITQARLDSPVRVAAQARPPFLSMPLKFL